MNNLSSISNVKWNLLMKRHCFTNNRVPFWAFIDSWTQSWDQVIGRCEHSVLQIATTLNARNNARNRKYKKNQCIKDWYYSSTKYANVTTTWQRYKKTGVNLLAEVRKLSLQYLSRSKTRWLWHQLKELSLWRTHANKRQYKYIHYILQVFICLC